MHHCHSVMQVRDCHHCFFDTPQEEVAFATFLILSLILLCMLARSGHTTAEVVCIPFPALRRR
ncbi:hypothetical protein BDV98DRAFT_564793 [Pterulicium gracile]|uniref:Uncharacterized protein n=1 Tax=Pterulicium gracile TaxID=1884261 RepID=A0A5C3QLW4_9AGAR|nr:hypothetical protein BDV98DRAFT_564793 [Pterula gracilis]